MRTSAREGNIFENPKRKRPTKTKTSNENENRSGSRSRYSFSSVVLALLFRAAAQNRAASRRDDPTRRRIRFTALSLYGRDLIVSAFTNAFSS
jgi:hypothetical protein